MFRNAFDGIDVEVDRPFLGLFPDKPQRFSGDKAASEGRMPMPSTSSAGKSPFELVED